jgi:hypothetical protein
MMRRWQWHDMRMDAKDIVGLAFAIVNKIMHHSKRGEGTDSLSKIGKTWLQQVCTLLPVLFGCIGCGGLRGTGCLFALNMQSYDQL